MQASENTKRKRSGSETPTSTPSSNVSTGMNDQDTSLSSLSLSAGSGDETSNKRPKFTSSNPSPPGEAPKINTKIDEQSKVEAYADDYCTAGSFRPRRSCARTSKSYHVPTFSLGSPKRYENAQDTLPNTPTRAGKTAPKSTKFGSFPRKTTKAQVKNRDAVHGTGCDEHKSSTKIPVEKKNGSIPADKKLPATAKAQVNGPSGAGHHLDNSSKAVNVQVPRDIAPMVMAPTKRKVVKGKQPYQRGVARVIKKAKQRAPRAEKKAQSPSKPPMEKNTQGLTKASAEKKAQDLTNLPVEKKAQDLIKSPAEKNAQGLTKPPVEKEAQDVTKPRAPVPAKTSLPNEHAVNLVKAPTPLDTGIAPQVLQHAEKHDLYSVVNKLFAHRAPGLNKPAPSGKPEVWADGRQELCETLHYYRSYQSASYNTGGFVRAFMFDKVAHPRDYLDGDVIISRAGGSLSKNKDSGEMVPGKDQSEETSTVQGLRNCMNHYNPVVIITGRDNPHLQSQPPHQYCVLDHFKPTHVWSEKSNGMKILRYRFEKLDVSKPSWWQPAEEEQVTVGSLEPPVTKICSSCEKISVQVYLNGWMCLQPDCDMFWHQVNGFSKGRLQPPCEVDEATLVYDPRFLKQKTPWPNEDHPYPLVPNGPELSGYAIPGEDTSQAFWAGIVCPDCGRCNSRLSWMGWECANPSCSFERKPPHTLIPASTLREPFWPITNSYTLSRDTHATLLKADISFAHGYRINRYTIPGIEGFITHMIANKSVVSEAHGPDAMFEELQQTDIGLRRRPMPSGQLKGESHCRQFLVNYGMPYKFIAATASHSFDGAAQPITDTRSRLNWAAKYLLTHETGANATEVEQDWAASEFNEVLALGYFEAQKISYHDDGEHGLGPTIATLSLGAPGTMRIRMKARHYHGVTSTTYDDSTPLPGCKAYDARRALAPGLARLKETDKVAYRARLKEIPKELGLRAGGNAKDVLKMELGHGDIVVMHGAKLQKYYEHAVEHAGKLRFALTCRHIDPESLGKGLKPSYEVKRDDVGYDGSKIV